MLLPVSRSLNIDQNRSTTSPIALSIRSPGKYHPSSQESENRIKPDAIKPVYNVTFLDV